MPSATSGIVINEIHVSSNNSVLGVDANGDGAITVDDTSIELHNTSAGTVDLTGWEVWYTLSNATLATKIATLNAHVIPSGGYYTIVEASPTFTGLQNVGSGQQADIEIVNNLQSTFALYNPTLNEYVLLKNSDATASEGTMAAAIVAEHPGATQSGATETTVSFTNSGPASIQRQFDGSDTWVNGEATLGEANCFAAGTGILTPGGVVPIETLAVGDLVRTAEGWDVPIRWVGRQTLVTRFAGPLAQMVRIAAGTLGATEDLSVTQDHGVWVDGLLANAGALLGLPGVSLVPLTETPPRFCVYHIETQAHEMVVANGVAAESFIDYRGRATLDNFGAFTELYGPDAELPIVEMAAPRITRAAQLPLSVLARFGAPQTAAAG